LKQDGRKVEVSVCSYDGKVLSNAKVTIKSLEEEERRRKRSIPSLRFNKRMKVFEADNMCTGHYALKVESKGFDTQERKVIVAQTGLKDTFILGTKGMLYYYRGKAKVPFHPRGYLLACSLKAKVSEREEEELLAYANQLGLRESSESIPKESVRIFRFPSNASKQHKREIQSRIAENPSVRIVGQVIRVGGNNITFLTKQLIVKFKPNITREEVQALVDQFNLKIVRNIPFAKNAFLLQSNEQANYELLNTNDKIVMSDMVEYAEPNLVITQVDDEVTPTDWLYFYGEQWYIDHIKLPGAWKALHRHYTSRKLLPLDESDYTFGRSNIIIAVMDTGIESKDELGTTSAVHPEFSGTATDGQSKVYKSFDFRNMVSNNNNIPIDPQGYPYWHGMACAGVAAALANNPSVFSGESKGIVGAAPNCRVMGLIRPFDPPGTEIQYADAYMWTAGFDPGWVIDSQNYLPGTVFPSVISPGADIITNSFGDGITYLPSTTPSKISDTMKECFDYLTTNGRDGKGVVLLFSAGNANSGQPAQLFQTVRPWAAYEKTVAVAASTSIDEKASYSNFGYGIDVCAPSSGGNKLITTCCLVGKGNQPGHPVNPGDSCDVMTCSQLFSSVISWQIINSIRCTFF
jgi:hypothetical protein